MRFFFFVIACFLCVSLTLSVKNTENKAAVDLKKEVDTANYEYLGFEGTTLVLGATIQRLASLFHLLTIFIFNVAAEIVADEINAPKNEAASNVCVTEDCLMENKNFGLLMLRNMDTSVDPCDNFYEFACGNFDDPNSHTTKSKFNEVFDKARNDVIRKVTNLLTNYSRPLKNKLFKSISDFYYSCENINDHHDSTHEDNINNLKETISEFGGWPVIEGEHWNETNFDWIDNIEKLQNIGFKVTHFLWLDVKLNPETKDPVFSLRLPPGEFTPQKMLDSKLKADYYKYMSQVALFLGADDEHVMELHDSYMFQYNLANIDFKNKEDNGKVYKFSVTEMSQKWPGINWIKFFNSQTHPYFNFTANTKIHLMYPKYISGFEKLINETPKRVQANYAGWKIVTKSIVMIKSRTLYDYKRSFLAAHSVEPDKFPCRELTIDTIKALVHAVYIRENPVDSRAKSQVARMFSNIQSKISEILNTTKWLDSDTKSMLVGKITSIKPLIGYPDELLDDDEFNKYFKDLIITRDNFFRNCLSALYFKYKMKLFGIFNRGSSVDGIYLFSLAKLFEYAFYIEYDKMIQISTELLRGYFFNVNRFNYLNFGVLGETIGHELGHAIDNTKRFRDKSGLAFKWSEVSNKSYEKEVTCLVNQYKNYTTNAKEDYLVKNTMNTGENIADNIGVKIAYLAYQDWITQNGQEPKLLGLPYTPNQLFWISYANKWCQSKSLLHDVHGVHSSNDKRVIGPLSNSVEFAKDFKCPVGSNMNPLNKCIFV